MGQHILTASDGTVTAPPPDNAGRRTLPTFEREVPFGRESKIVCGSVDGTSVHFMKVGSQQGEEKVPETRSI